MRVACDTVGMRPDPQVRAVTVSAAQCHDNHDDCGRGQHRQAQIRERVKTPALLFPPCISAQWPGYVVPHGRDPTGTGLAPNPVK
jgi:hypothetical protein